MSDPIKPDILEFYGPPFATASAGRKAIDDHFVLRANNPLPSLPGNAHFFMRTIRIEPESNGSHARSLSFERWISALEAEAERREYDSLDLAGKFRRVIQAREQPGADLNARFGETMNLAREWETAGLGSKASDYCFKDTQDPARNYDRHRRRQGRDPAQVRPRRRRLPNG